ncbi:MAG: ATP synthase F1 subunit gamma [Candidatus Yanofskybacteria bacterium RIFCSPHIGHO2_02_FULL_44_12b]|uniref:ATP synthase gamma chain n=1 Tax=Candidatus Yanofskybacteria bacterium RIFCSPLOWO2_01_FULL_44_22 TaxID=1802697 RepID=A0A1F8GMT9_9BACT|nr:MAG: ATP synthase F1 subunit gamma [Candidatus Yanofskybacteria bacterium RIFCSPHIGHO2_01_FULL_44_24]OGN15628.1 MAG: ATP synthase F1 subunit gamma [Candidatus Yanofskybacteria bacterium RIFCSPHIGHO2_02_FULL_44_12b]OGN26683.1 MAG: ATP synthase F1 subunit gamma [Candidatus Yanofskybacteria bacterium RIFCSPLOWO2_01_FULL_44_22]
MSIIEVKNRIKAVKNIGQITKAMEVVAATKMRKSQEVALHSRPYAFKALYLLSTLAKHAEVKTKLMEVRHIKKTLLVIVTSDRGLAGSFNSQVFRMADSFLKSYQDIGNDGLKVIAVGKKAISYAGKKKLNMVDGFSGFGDFVEPAETYHLSDKITSAFLSGEWDRVITISTHFRTTLKQEVLMRQILPVDLEKIQKTIDEIIPESGRFAGLRVESRKLKVGNSDSEPLSTPHLSHSPDYIFEPSPAELIESLVDHLVKMEVYHLVLEANASEHSARMVAMKTASDNAQELSENLNLEYNKARQAGITKELIEITSAVNTLQ